MRYRIDLIALLTSFLDAPSKVKGIEQGSVAAGWWCAYESFLRL